MEVYEVAPLYANAEDAKMAPEMQRDTKWPRAKAPRAYRNYLFIANDNLKGMYDYTLHSILECSGFKVFNRIKQSLS